MPASTPPPPLRVSVYFPARPWGWEPCALRGPPRDRGSGAQEERPDTLASSCQSLGGSPLPIYPRARAHLSPSFRQVSSTAGPESPRCYRSPYSTPVPDPDPVVPRSGDSCFGYPVPAHHSLCCWCSFWLPGVFSRVPRGVPELPPSSCPDNRSSPTMPKVWLSRPLRPLVSHLSPPGSLRSSPDLRCPLPEAAPGAGLHR